MTLPTALAAPVDEGMMLLLTLVRPPRQSLLEGPSDIDCLLTGGRQTFDDTVLVVNDSGEGSKAVGCAGSIGNLK